MDKTTKEKTMKTVRITRRRGVVISVLGDPNQTYVLSGPELEENVRMGDEIRIVYETGPFTEDGSLVGTVVGMVADVTQVVEDPDQ
jgi:hypothetical protein